MEDGDELWSRIRDEHVEPQPCIEDTVGDGLASSSLRFFKFGLGDSVEWCATALLCKRPSVVLGGCSVFWHVRYVVYRLGWSTNLRLGHWMRTGYC